MNKVKFQMRMFIIASLCKFVMIATASLSVIACSAKEAFYWQTKKGNMYLLSADKTVVGQLLDNKPEGMKVAGEIMRLDSSTFRVVRRYTAVREIDSASLSLDFKHHSHSRFWMIPSVSYNGNHWGRGKEPKGAAENGQWRTFSYRRTPIPGATYSEGDRFAVATWSDTPTGEYQDFSCSLAPEESQTTHRILWPEEELPTMYNNRDSHIDGYKKRVSLKKGDVVTLTLYLTVSAVEPGHRAERHFLRKAWEYAEKPVVPVFDAQKLWALSIRYATESLWAEEGSFKGFSIGLHPEGEKGWKQRGGGKYEIGWCGQNASLANSLLTDYIKHRNTESLNKALATLDAYPEHDNFTEYRYSTFGATSVSVQHHHLDPYALYWVSDWFKLAELTGDRQWKEKALAIWRNGSQLVSDGTLEINGRVRPAGSQNEAYFESNWAFDSGKKRINSWLVAWPGAFRLETLRRLNDSQENMEELKNRSVAGESESVMRKTASEPAVEQLLAENPSTRYFCFTEDRAHDIRLNEVRKGFRKVRKANLAPFAKTLAFFAVKKAEFVDYPEQY